MKKIIVLFVSVAVLMSCTKDSSEKKDPIIGAWYVYDAKHSCTKKFDYIFNENGTGTFANFEIYNGECSAIGIISFKWENKGSSIYTLTIKEGENEGQIDTEVVFSDNNNTLVLKIGGETVTWKRKK